MTAQGHATDSVGVRQHLERILNSSVFQKAQRSQRFLRHVVEEALSNQADAIKEYAIALKVFDRGSGYDPAVDATVRVEASRLRSRLRDYYAGEGRGDAIVIEIPKGTYVPVFTSRVSRLTADSSDVLTDDQPDRPARRGKPPSARGARVLAFLASGMAILFLLILALVVWNRQHRLITGHAAPLFALAVLPITNETGDPALDYLTIGLTDSLIRQLSEVPALKLISHDAAFRFRDHKAGTRAIGQTLGVRDVITGTLNEAGGRLVVDAELSSVDDGSIVFSREYLAEKRDLRLVQASIVRDTLTKLHVETSALNPSRRSLDLTRSREAYEEFLKGDFSVGRASAAQLHEGIAHFEKAVALDPAFDLAWSSLAGAHVLLGLYFESPHKQMNLARESAERAIRLNPTLGEAHGTLGVIHLVYDWDIAAAETEMTSASAERAAVCTLSCTVHLLDLTGRHESAEEMLRRVLSFDPQSAALLGELGCVKYYGGNYNAAIQEYREALRLSPQSAVLCWGLAKSLNQQKRYREALRILRSFRRDNGFEPPLITSEIGYALGEMGDKAGALAIIRELQQANHSIFIDPYFVSIVYLAIDDRQAAFEWLGRALDSRSVFMISIASEPKWRPLRSDPRLANIMHEVFQVQGQRPR